MRKHTILESARGSIRTNDSHLINIITQEESFGSNSSRLHNVSNSYMGVAKNLLSSTTLAPLKKDNKHLNEIKRQFEDQLFGYDQNIQKYLQPGNK
jgi:hypothetical protein